MELLYSNILPLDTEDEQETIIDCFQEQMEKADQVEIAVGYTSAASISELDLLTARCNLQKIRLTIGMYFMKECQRELIIWP